MLTMLISIKIGAIVKSALVGPYAALRTSILTTRIAGATLIRPIFALSVLSFKSILRFGISEFLLKLFR